MAIEIRIYSRLLKDTHLSDDCLEGQYKRYNGGTWFAETIQPTETSETVIRCFEIIETILLKDGVSICEILQQLPENWMENPIQKEAKSLLWKSIDNSKFLEEIVGSMCLLRLNETELLEKKQQGLLQYVSDSDIKKIIESVSAVKLSLQFQQPSQFHAEISQQPSQQLPPPFRESSQPLSSQPPRPSPHHPSKTQGEHFQRHHKPSLYSREPSSSDRPSAHHSSQRHQQSQRSSERQNQQPRRLTQSHPRQVEQRLQQHQQVHSEVLYPHVVSQDVPRLSPPPLPSQEEAQMQQEKPARKAPPHISGRLMEPLLLDSF